MIVKNLALLLSGLLLTGVLCTGCHYPPGMLYPIEERSGLSAQQLLQKNNYDSSSRICLTDGSYILCEEGFIIIHDTIHATGDRYTFPENSKSTGVWNIPRDSIATVIIYDKAASGERVAASLLLYGAGTIEAIVLAVLLVREATKGFHW